MINLSGIDWNEIIMLLIGALVGIGSSAAMMIIQNANEKCGKLSIYVKFNCLKNMGKEGWGVFENPEGGLSFLIPVIFEIENTSKRARIMRDVSLVLLKENKVIAKMTQINYLQTTSRKNVGITHEEEHYYGDINGSYSFVIEPTSIKRENCVYLYKISRDDIQNKSFDSIALQFYNEKNGPMSINSTN